MSTLVAYLRIEELPGGSGGGPARVAGRGGVGTRSGPPPRRAKRACAAAGRDRARDALVRERFLQVLAARSRSIEPDGSCAAFVALDAGGAGVAAVEAAVRRLALDLVPACGRRLDVGIGPSRLVARIAADLLRSATAPLLEPRPWRLEFGGAGEARVLYVDRRRVHRFLAPLSVTRLWPLPAHVVQILLRLALFRIGDLARVSPTALRGALPQEWAEMAIRLARGEDDRPLCSSYPPPCVRTERRLDGAGGDVHAARRTALALAAELAAALRSRGQAARELWLFISSEDASPAGVRTFAKPVASVGALQREALRLLDQAEPARGCRALVLEARALCRTGAAQIGLWDGHAGGAGKEAS